MKKYGAVIFDFDGTIADSFLGVARSARYALKEEFGIGVSGLETFRKFVGPPLHDSFLQYYNLSREDAARAVQRFRERYGEKGHLEMRLYDGIEELLRALREKGLKLAIASSKASDMLEKALVHCGIRPYFDAVVGVEDVIDHSSKAENIIEAMRLIDAAPAESLMVGDRYFDAEGAEIAGVDFIAALYAGFGPREEFDGFPSVFYAETPEEIGTFILAHS